MVGPKIIPPRAAHGIKSPRLLPWKYPGFFVWRKGVPAALHNMQAAKLKPAVILYLMGMVVIHIAIFWSVRTQIRKGYSDFSILYCAGTIVRQGRGHQLYDNVTQFQVQRGF